MLRTTALASRLHVFLTGIEVNSMAKLQRYFEQFHNTIRADYDMNKTLREKKDIILNRIRNHLKDKDRPGFDELLQGSYKMKTGVDPVAGLEYDIDVGLRFSFKETDYDAKTVRRWVFEAVVGHTDNVEEMGPCIRVTYATGGYHVDLVVYCVWTDTFGVEQFRLAHKTDGWRPAEPVKLLDHVKAHRKPFEDTEDAGTSTDQFRRVVRYQKRWNDVAIPAERSDKPTGLAFTLLACERLIRHEYTDGDPDDRSALASLARQAGSIAGRLTAKKPTPEYEDMFGRLSDEEMKKLKERFIKLADVLDEAGRTVDVRDACKKIREVLGDDFPLPDPEDTAKKSSAPAVISSSSSA
jgi:hypothetical protein